MATDFVLVNGTHIVITPADAQIVQAAAAEVVDSQ
jgi:hypothetical protein